MLNWLIQNSPLLYLTQSLWRDEAFSILIAQKPILFLLTKLDFEPPFYYLLLHFWLKIFGISEIAARSLSLFGFFLAGIVIIFWAEKLFPKNYLRWFLPVLFFTNPMLLYYAFEVRTYGWYIFFSVLSFHSYTSNRWRLFTVATVLGFYTHTYFLIVPFVQFIHWYLYHRQLFKTPHRLITTPFIKFGTLSFILIVPWLIKIALLAGKLKQSWYFPVDLHLIFSVLGNLFIGFEGTPWYLWPYTALLSIVLLICFFLAIKPKQHRVITSYLLLQALLPLAVIISISFAKPLFVNRYVIAVTIAEILLIAFAINSLKKSWLQAILSLVIISATIWFNLWYPPQHAKADIRTSINTVNALLGPTDIIFVTSPLIYFETLYYASNPNQVFLYTPHGGNFPWYVGDAAFDPKKIRTNLPSYPTRAFLIHESGDFEINYEQT